MKEVLIEKFKNEYKILTGKDVVVYEKKHVNRNYIKIKVEQRLKNCKMSLLDIHKQIAEVFNIDCLENNRKLEYLHARAIMFTIAVEMGYSTMDIERYTTYHHTTVMWAIKSKITQHEEYKEKLQKFREYINVGNGKTETNTGNRPG